MSEPTPNLPGALEADYADNSDESRRQPPTTAAPNEITTTQQVETEDESSAAALEVAYGDQNENNAITVPPKGERKARPPNSAVRLANPAVDACLWIFLVVPISFFTIYIFYEPVWLRVEEKCHKEKFRVLRQNAKNHTKIMFFRQNNSIEFSSLEILKISFDLGFPIGSVGTISILVVS